MRILCAAALVAGILQGTAADATSVVFDDMEHGDPFGAGWFAFNGSVGGGGLGPDSTDLPPSDGGSFSLGTGWGSGGTPGFYGGFGRTSPTSLETANFFNFWINPDPGQTYSIEINLQEDDNGDGVIDTVNDDEFQFQCEVGAAGPCAISGGGWQLVSIGLSAFNDDNSFLTGGNSVFDPLAPGSSGNGELINLIFVINGTGSNATFRTDNWSFTDEIPGATPVPLPGSLPLIAGAIALLPILRRRKASVGGASRRQPLIHPGVEPAS